MVSGRLLAAFGFLLTACGSESHIVLELTSSRLSIPADIGVVTVRSHAPEETAMRLDLTLDLSGVDAFPIDILLEPSEDTPTTLVHQIDCFADEAPVCSLTATHTWTRGVTSRVRVSLDPP